MTTIAVNLGTVASGFEDLPIGSYLGEISKVKLREATEAGKFPQIMVSYTVIDGDHLGKRQTQWLSLSPKAMGFVKDFFSKFGLGDIPNLEFDPETDELNDPDLYGAQVIFKNVQDKKDAERIRTSLSSVEEWSGGDAPASVVKPKPAKASVEATVGRLPNQIEADIEEVADDPAAVKAAAKAARIAAAQAALDAAAEDDDEEEEETPAPAKPARTAAPRPAATAVADKPVRRTLR